MIKKTKKKITATEAIATMDQLQKDATIPSLLFVTRKLGEVEGVISVQVDPDGALVDVQKDFKLLYDKLVEDAGIEPEQESEHVFECIGRDS